MKLKLANFDWPVGLVVRDQLTAKPEVVGSIVPEARGRCDEHEYLFCVWV